MTTGNSTRRGSPVAVKNADGRRKPTHQQIEVRHKQIWELLETLRDAGPEPGTACGRLAYLAEDLFSASALDQSGLVHVYDVQAMLIGALKCGDATPGQSAIIEKVLPMVDEYVNLLDGVNHTNKCATEAAPISETLVHSPSNVKHLTLAERQAGWIFSTIAEMACSVRELATNVVAEGDDKSIWDFTVNKVVAARDLCSQIGLLADIGATKTGGVELMNGAESWLLPPAYHLWLKIQKKSSC